MVCVQTTRELCWPALSGAHVLQPELWKTELCGPGSFRRHRITNQTSTGQKPDEDHGDAQPPWLCGRLSNGAGPERLGGMMLLHHLEVGPAVGVMFFGFSSAFNTYERDTGRGRRSDSLTNRPVSEVLVASSSSLRVRFSVFYKLYICKKNIFLHKMTAHFLFLTFLLHCGFNKVYACS